MAVSFLFAPLLHPFKTLSHSRRIAYMRITGRLESGHTLTGIGGSNPSLSAITFVI